MALFIGTGGTPISSKGRSTLSGLERIKELGLNAMEVEFVRGVNMKEDMAKEVGDLAKELKIKLSIHAPYYINLASGDKKKVNDSKRRIIESCERGFDMGAEIIVFHPAYYGKLSKEECYHIVKRECESMVDTLRTKGIKNVLLGLETTGKKSQFGTLDECIKIAKEVKGCMVVVDWAHIYARNGGNVNFGEIIEKVMKVTKSIHSHFSCINFSESGERNHLTLDAKKPDYSELVREIKHRKMDITLISESPNLEEDALYLKNMIESI
ncbi:MAG: TIM barrel protein [Candidatus Aenigmatarchaeota archaeon]